MPNLSAEQNLACEASIAMREAFSIFWLCTNWSGSKNLWRSRGWSSPSIFSLPLQFVCGQNVDKGLRMGALAVQAILDKTP